MNFVKIVVATTFFSASLIALEASGIRLSKQPIMTSETSLAQNFSYADTINIENDGNKSSSHKRVLSRIDRAPIYFEQNIGQEPEHVVFTSKTPGYKLSLTQSDAILTFRPQNSNIFNKDNYPQLHLKFNDSNPTAKILGLSKLKSTSSYFHSNNRSDWYQGAPHFLGVKYKDIYPGIDLEYYGNKHNLEYDFVVKPGHDPDVIQMSYNGIDSISLDTSGNAVLHFGEDELIQKKPFVYQLINGQQQVVNAEYVLQNYGKNKTGVGFKIASWNPEYDLVIDPVLSYSSLVGGDLLDSGGDIAVDTTGSVYIVGQTNRANPLKANSTVYNCNTDCSSDVVVSKFNSDGSELSWTVVLSGSGEEDGLGIIVDTQGNSYVAGWTSSDDFPMINALDNDIDGLSDGFLTKISASGTELLFSTYFGKERSEIITDIDRDAQGDIYISGRTSSQNSAEITTSNDPHIIETDGFITKFNENGSIQYFTKYIGGSRYDSIDAIAVDLSGSIFATGTTDSVDFPLVSPLYDTLKGVGDAFITKLNPAGEALIFSSYFGGSNAESGRNLKLDDQGNPVIVGITTSSDLPTKNALDADANGPLTDWDSFVSKFSGDGSELLFSTYLGGNGGDYVSGLSLDSDNNIYVSGYTLSDNFPLLEPLFSQINGRSDLFISKLNPNASALLYSSYFGGSNEESFSDIVVDNNGGLYLTGLTYSSDFPVTNSVNFTQNSTGGNGDIFVSKLSDFINYDIADSKWYLIALPYVPPTGSTVEELFADNFPGEYNKQWYLYKYNTGTGKYKKLSLDDELEHSTAYWIRHSSGQTITVDVPGGSTTAPVIMGEPCPPDTACFVKILATTANTKQYHFVGNPFAHSINWDDLRFKVDSGQCSNAQGCTLTEAKTANLIDDIGHSYVASLSVTLSTGDMVAAWQGFWIRTFAGAHGKTPRLIFPE